jgi:hypothetical protein
MRKMRSALACLVLAGGGLVGGVAAATPAAAANCSWLVLESAQVRENPSINSVVRKTKERGDIVTGSRSFCNPVIGTDGRYWHEVNCGCATDGLGYIIYYKLQYLTPV